MMRGGIRSGLLLAALSLVTTSCSVVAMSDAEGTGTMNQCSSDSQCSTGRCIDGTCSAGGGQFDTVLFEVTPPADSDTPSVRFLKRVDNLSSQGGEQNIELSPVAHVTGKVTSATASSADCDGVQFYDPLEGANYTKADDKSLPVRVTITPSIELLGIPTETYAVEAVPSLDANNTALGAAEFSFALNVPPGQYDIYVQTFPQPLIGANQDHCVIPPRLYRKQSITSDVMLNLELDAPTIIDVTVDVPVEVGPLDGWTLDVVEANHGRLLSNQVTLGSATPSGARLTYDAKLIYAKVLGEEPPPPSGGMPAAAELVRLAPPQGQVKPTIYMEPWVLDLYGDGIATINQLTPFADEVVVEGQVQALGMVPPGATVTLISSEIAGVNPGLSASFRRTVEAVVSPDRPNDPPKFNVTLVPGKYTVYAVPPAGSGLAATQTTWDVGKTSPQAGKVLDLVPETSLTGWALDPLGSSALVGASVNAVAAAASGVTLRDQTVGADPAAEELMRTMLFVPRASTAVVDPQGAFELRADPGTFDLSVRPTVSSGFAWLVEPSLMISGPEQDLGQLFLPMPIVYQGSVSFYPSVGYDDVVPNALIRAYIYLNEDHEFTDDAEGSAKPAKSVVQVAEARADDKGRFKLLLPSRLH